MLVLLTLANIDIVYMEYLANGCTINAEGFSDINGSIVVAVHFKYLFRQSCFLRGFVSVNIPVRRSHHYGKVETACSE